MERLKLDFGAIGNSFSKIILALLKDERGQGTVEYILLLMFVVTGAAALARTVLSGLDKGILALGAELEKDLKTGRTPVSVWIN